METIKLNALSRWSRMATKGAVAFDGPERRIRLLVNVESETAFFYDVGKVKAQLLAVVPPGLRCIEFFAGGVVTVFGVPSREGAQVWYQTAESEPTVVQAVDGRSFTKLMQRRERNPEVERMFAAMQRNANRRQAAMEAEFARLQGQVHELTKSEAKARKGKADEHNGKASGANPKDGTAPSETGKGASAPKADDKSD